MSEVLGDADPPARGGRLPDDDRPAFDDFDDDSDFGDGFDTEPGPLRRFVAKVATRESLAIAAIVIASASLLDLPVVGDAVNSLSVSRGFDAAFLGRVNAAGQLVVAAIGFALAITARRRKPVAEPNDPPTNWVPQVSGAALIIGAVSGVLAVVAFLIAGTAHQPTDGGFQSGISVVPQATVTAGPAPILDQGNQAPVPGFDFASPPNAIASFVLIDPSSGAQVSIDPSTGALVTVGPSPST
ncbi:MAG: hypothetical protein ACRDV3_11405 [Acidothermaceae bacterium]